LKLLTKYFKKKPLFGFISIFLLLILTHYGHGQTNNTIHSIEITGNKKTKTSYLQRFLYSQPGERYDSLKINNDLRRLRTLAPVMQALCDTIHKDSGIVVQYKIEERFTILPVGDFGITDDNFWIGIGVMESNLAGRGMYIYGFYRYNKDHTLHLIFRNPYLNGTKWGVEMQVKNLPVTEEYKIDTSLKHQYTDISVAGKYEIHFENDLFFGTSFRYQSAKYLFTQEGNTISEDVGFRRSIVPYARWQIQNLDIEHFYLQGWRNNLFIEAALPLNASNKPVLLFYDEFRLYRRLAKKGNFALRVLAGLSNEASSVFSPFIADSYYNFRGIGYRAYKGNTIGLINLEYRQTVFENRLGGIQAVVFSDSGVLLNNEYNNTDTGFDKAHFIYGGIGARLVFKKAYNAILSIDYGVNLQNFKTGGWVFGWGQYF